MSATLTAGHWPPAALDALRAIDTASLPVVEGAPRLGPCIGSVGKFVCIGLNYHDHARETGNAIPEYPIVFLKANSAINGPYDNVVLPRGSRYSDWEVELGVVIGTAAKYVDEDQALDHVAGYCVVNDVSERKFPDKAVWPVDEGQILRHLRAIGAMDGHG